MNREIKYQAWDKKRKRMYKVLHLHLATVLNGGIWATVEGYDIIEQKEIQLQIQPENIVVREYTGLKDCHGKEIYEGDVVKAGEGLESDSPYASYVKVPEGELFIIKCLLSGFTAVHIKHNADIPNLHTNINNYRLWNSQRKVEVIGNIYENPELLSENAILSPPKTQADAKPQL